MSMTPVSRKRAREGASFEAEGPFKQAKTAKAEHVAARAISAIEAMPNDLMGKIFTYLGPSARFLARSVCKAFNQAIVDYPPTTFTINGGMCVSTPDVILSKLKQFPITNLKISARVDAEGWYQRGLQFSDKGLAVLREYSEFDKP